MSGECRFAWRLTCESPRCRPRLGRVVRADARSARARFGCPGSGGLLCLWLFDLVEGDGVAERFKLALEAAGAMFGRVALALPVRSELSERDLVTNDVVVGDEEVVADRADRLGLTAPSPEL